MKDTEPCSNMTFSKICILKFIEANVGLFTLTYSKLLENSPKAYRNRKNCEKKEKPQKISKNPGIIPWRTCKSNIVV